jgi:hypothetical protein
MTIMACSSSEEMSQNEAISIADNYLRQKGPGNVEMPYHSPIATDHGSFWTVKYELRAGWMGNHPQLDIDKTTRRVIRDYGEQ